MERIEKNISEYQKLAFKCALNRTGNVIEAREIASQTLTLYLKKKHIMKNTKGWIINTTRNYCNKLFEESKKYKLWKKELKDDLLSKSSCIERDDSLKTAFRDSLNTLNRKELKTLYYFYQSSQSIKKMYKVYGGSYQALRKRISRIKKKLKAETYRRLGVIASKKIVTPQLENLINNFLRSFRINLKNETLEKMYYYFSEVNLKNYKPSFDIKKIVEYSIQFNDYVYKILVIFKNQNGDIDSFSFEFYIDNKNYLKIKKLPQKPKKMIRISINSDEGKKIVELLRMYPENRESLPAFFSNGFLLN
ncbi:MAG: sigma-70 family RNA polymerase sigma factor [Candidatus Cloacimonetes bacterium]|nr:sigma-70 family RNA polymerase sigma factor [Candidatus Cloacimonadota bacterium]